MKAAAARGLGWFGAWAWGLMLSLLSGCLAAPPRALALHDEPQPPELQSPARVALVLSGGGLRGLAHLGVLRVLHAHGLRPALVVGTSVGAIVGGAYASGVSIEALETLPLPTQLDPWAVSSCHRHSAVRGLKLLWRRGWRSAGCRTDRKSTRLNSSHRP